VVKKGDSGNGVNRTVKRVIIWMPVIAIMSCLLTIVDPRFGVFVWIVFLFIGMMVRRKKESIQ